MFISSYHNSYLKNMHNFNSVRHYLRQVRQQKVNYKVKRQVRILMKTLKKMAVGILVILSENKCSYCIYIIINNHLSFSLK